MAGFTSGFGRRECGFKICCSMPLVYYSPALFHLAALPHPIACLARSMVLLQHHHQNYYCFGVKVAVPNIPIACIRDWWLSLRLLYVETVALPATKVGCAEITIYVYLRGVCVPVNLSATPAAAIRPLREGLCIVLCPPTRRLLVHKVSG